MGDIKHVQSVLIRAVGLLWETKHNPSQNREGEGAQALGGHQANQKINNQIEDGIWDGEVAKKRRGCGKTDGEAFFTSFGATIVVSKNEGQMIKMRP